MPRPKQIKRKPNACSFCGQSGHNRITCTTRENFEAETRLLNQPNKVEPQIILNAKEAFVVLYTELQAKRPEQETLEMFNSLKELTAKFKKKLLESLDA